MKYGRWLSLATALAVAVTVYMCCGGPLSKVVGAFVDVFR